jgi:GH15 family glucan-1,4-alpha-glucosidase
MTPDLAAAILERIPARMVRDDGAALESSFHRPPETIELDQNGQLLHAPPTHWAWTGDFTLIGDHWSRILALADYPLRPAFRGPAPGLVNNSREFWERSQGHGVRDGYELASQPWNIAERPLAAEMAGPMNDASSAQRWREAAALMKRTFLEDPRYSFIENGRFIKRRLADGRHHATMEPPDRNALPPGMPLRVDPVNYCDPDAASVFPMLLGIADPRGAAARATLESMEALWNQRWSTGGYGRYHVTGEPDSPGPWPFASLFIARSYLEAGDPAKVRRVLRGLSA